MKLELFLMIDHCAIYFLIAGTYTPVLVMGCRDPDTMAVQKGVAVCTLIYWSMVFFGVVMEHVFAVRKPYWYSKFVLGMYVMLGFGGVPYIATCSLVQDADVIPWLELGGLTYVFGIVFFLLDKRYPAMHVVWHIFVGLGALFHFVAVWNLTTQVLKDPHRSCAPIDSELSGLGTGDVRGDGSGKDLATRRALQLWEPQRDNGARVRDHDGIARVSESRHPAALGIRPAALGADASRY